MAIEEEPSLVESAKFPDGNTVVAVPSPKTKREFFFALGRQSAKALKDRGLTPEQVLAAAAARVAAEAREEDNHTA